VPRHQTFQLSEEFLCLFVLTKGFVGQCPSVTHERVVWILGLIEFGKGGTPVGVEQLVTTFDVGVILRAVAFAGGKAQTREQANQKLDPGGTAASHAARVAQLAESFRVASADGTFLRGGVRRLKTRRRRSHD
jgi:hypothetical protein